MAVGVADSRVGSSAGSWPITPRVEYLGIWNVTSSCLEWNLAIRSWFAVIPSYVNSELAVGGCDTTYMKAVQLATIPLEVEHF